MATTPITTNKDILRSEIERVWENGDLSFAHEFVAEDYRLHDPLQSETILGPDGFKAYAEMMADGFSAVDITDIELIGEGDFVAARYTARFVHDGEFLGREPTGETLSTSGMIFAQFEDGMLIEEWRMDDALGLLQQLGFFESLDLEA